MSSAKKAKKVRRRRAHQADDGDDSKHRSLKGLSAENALKKWSNRAAYAAMLELVDSKDRMGSDPDSIGRHFEYSRRRDALEKAFEEKLKQADVFCSGILERTASRTIISPSAWDVLGVNYDFDYVSGNGLLFKAVEFFEADHLPRNITEVPDWFWAYQKKRRWTEEFVTLDASYRRVVMRGEEFSLSDLQAAVVRTLHEASRTPDPWCVSKQIVKDAGSEQNKIVDLFRDKPRWHSLIEVRRDGRCRLNLHDRRTS